MIQLSNYDFRICTYSYFIQELIIFKHKAYKFFKNDILFDKGQNKQVIIERDTVEKHGSYITCRFHDNDMLKKG